MNRFEKQIAACDEQLTRLDKENQMYLSQAAEVKQDRERAERLLKAAEYVRANDVSFYAFRDDGSSCERPNLDFVTAAKVLADYCLRDSGQ